MRRCGNRAKGRISGTITAWTVMFACITAPFVAHQFRGRRGEHQAVLTPSVCTSAQIVLRFHRRQPEFDIAPVERPGEWPVSLVTRLEQKLGGIHAESVRIGTTDCSSDWRPNHVLRGEESAMAAVAGCAARQLLRRRAHLFRRSSAQDALVRKCSAMGVPANFSPSRRAKSNSDVRGR